VEWSEAHESGNGVNWPPAASAPVRLTHARNVPTLMLAGVVLAGVLLGAVMAGLSIRLGLWVVPLLVAPTVVLLMLDRPMWAAGLVLLAMPIGVKVVPDGPFGLPFIQLVAIGATGLMALARLAAGEPPLRWPRPMWWAAILSAVAVLETPIAIDLHAAIVQDVQLLSGILVALAVATAVVRLRDLRRLACLALLSGSAILLLALPDATEQRARFGAAIVENRAQGPFSEPNQLGALSAIVLFLACGFMLGGRRPWQRAGASLLLLLSRGSWIGVALGLVAMVFLLPRGARWALVLRGLALLVTVLVLALSGLAGPQQFGVVGARLRTLTNPEGNPSDARPLLYREAWREVRARPLTGFGPGGFPTASLSPESVVSSVRAYHAHNVLLTMAAEAGLPAAALLVGFTLAVGLALRRAVVRLREPPDRRDRALLAALGGALVTIVGQGMVDVVLRSPVIVMLVWALVGLALAGDRITGELAATPRTEPA
jgi:putative inorganic carbon (HCO3(-)) transporter